MQLQHTANNQSPLENSIATLPSEMRIKSGREIKRVMRVGCKAVRPHVVVLAVRGASRFSVVASRKYGPAVDRNLFKRRIREFFRQNCRSTGLDVVVIARKASLDASYAEISKSIEICLQRVTGQL